MRRMGGGGNRGKGRLLHLRRIRRTEEEAEEGEEVGETGQVEGEGEGRR
jgi:hypothetical protein